MKHGNTSDDSTVISKVPITVKLDKFIENRINIIRCHRTSRTSGKGHGIPGAFSTEIWFFRLFIHSGILILHILCTSFRLQRVLRLFMHFQNIAQNLSLFIAFHNLINKTMLQKKFCSLKSLRKLLADGLFNDSRTCKTNQCSRLCQNNITQHRKACRHTAGSRVGQYTDKQLTCLMMFLKSCRGLCHLHQRNNSLLHSGTAGACKNNHRKLLLRSTLDHPCDFLTDHMTHTAHQETCITDTDRSLLPQDPSLTGDNCLIQSRLFLCCQNFLFISRKIQRIGKFHLLIPLFKASLIQQHFHPAISMNPEVTAAFRTDIIIVCYVLHIDRLTAFITLLPESLRNVRFPFRLFIFCIDYGICFFKHISKHSCSPYHLDYCSPAERSPEYRLRFYHLQYSGKCFGIKSVSISPA